MNLWTCQIQEVEMTKTLLALSRIYVVAVQSLSHVWLFVTPWTAAQQASCPSLPPRAHSTHFHWVSGSTQPPSPLLPSSPPAFNLFQHQGLFQWVGFSHQVVQYAHLKCTNQWFYNKFTEFCTQQPQSVLDYLHYLQKKPVTPCPIPLHFSIIPALGNY